MFTMKRKKTAPDILISQAYRDPKYQGKHIIIIGNKIYAKKAGRQSVIQLERLLKRYPKQTPSITYIPKSDTGEKIFQSVS